MRSLIFLFFLATPCLSQAQASADTLRITLNEAVEMGMDNNQQVEQVRLDIENAENRIQEVKAQIWPEITLNAQYTRNIKRPVFFLPEGEGPFGGGVIEAGFDNSYQASAQASMPLYNQQLFASADVAELSKKLSRTALDVEKNELASEIQKAYYNALLAKETIYALEVSLNNARQNFENVQNLYDQGQAPRYDVIRAQVQVENLKPEISAARNNYIAAINQLKLLTGAPINQPVALQGRLIDFYNEQENAELSQYNVSENPGLMQVQQQTTLQEEQIDVEEAAYYPSLSLFGNYQYQAQANDFNFGEYRWINTSAAGLSLSVPVFSGFRRKYRVNQGQIELKKLRLQTDYLRKSLETQAENAIQRLLQAKDNIEAQEANIRQAEKGYEIARISYEKGAANLLEVNDAELALTQARMNYIQAISDYLLAQVDYNTVTGKGWQDEQIPGNNQE